MGRRGQGKERKRIQRDVSRHAVGGSRMQKGVPALHSQLPRGTAFVNVSLANDERERGCRASALAKHCPAGMRRYSSALEARVSLQERYQQTSWCAPSSHNRRTGFRIMDLTPTFPDSCLCRLTLLSADGCVMKNNHSKRLLIYTQ